MDVRALAHDLRNPLGAITLSVETLRETARSNEQVGSKFLKPLDVISRSAGRLERMLDQLADIARSSGGAAAAGRSCDTAAGAPAGVLSAESLRTIGLAFLHEMVRLQGGDITTHPAPGGETAFSIAMPPGKPRVPGASSPAVDSAVQSALRWLPDEQLRQTLEAALLPPQAPANLERASSPSGRSAPCEGRILLAEDNVELRNYVEQLLSDRWTVEAVGDGTSALRIASENPPDLVLADIMMPGIDGLSLVRALRADPNTQAIPVLLLSAQVGQESKMEGSLAGANDYLVKPFSARELIARVTLHLELGRVRAQLAHAQAKAERAERELAGLKRSSS